MVIQNPIPQSGNSVFENLYVYGDCKFDKDVTINGQLKYDELSLVRLTVTDKITAGIVTATTYYGDGSNLSGVDSTSLKDNEGTVIVQAETSGVNITGIVTATSFTTTSGTSSQFLKADGSVDGTDYLVKVTYGYNSGAQSTTYVYPPSGYLIGDLIGFIPSRRTGHFSGGVDGNDSIYCYYSIDTANNRITVVCYFSEQRSNPTVNWMALWRKS